MEWQFDLIAGPFGTSSDGLCWDGSGMLFSVAGQELVQRYEPASGSITEFCKYLPDVRGLAIDTKRNLYGCQGLSRRLISFRADGRIFPMEHTLDGHFHNNPYDLVIDRHDRMWFSDPRESTPTRGPQLEPPLEHASVLRLELDRDRSWRIRRMTFDTAAPRGVALSSDERTLYVAESSEADDGKRELRGYSIEEDDTLGAYKVLHKFGADHRGIHRGIKGMCLDEEGNVIACAGWGKSGAGPMVYVFTPSGRVLETHAVPVDRPMNCAFGDDDLSTLYVTSGDGHLFRVRNSGHRGPGAK